MDATQLLVSARNVPRVRAWHVLAGIAIILIGMGGVVWGASRFSEPPATQQEAEEHLDRSVLAYEVWDETPYIVFAFGGAVHFDELILDPISIAWPPTPRWQWSVTWSSMDRTTDPASVGRSTHPITGAIYGQLNDNAIVWIEARIDGAWVRFPVSAPAFLVQLPEGEPRPDAYRWLDADERVVWQADRDGEPISS